jgi:hypothetical protein
MAEGIDTPTGKLPGSVHSERLALFMCFRCGKVKKIFKMDWFWIGNVHTQSNWRCVCAKCINEVMGTALMRIERLKVGFIPTDKKVGQAEEP